ncbi:MAG TPA: sugar transferase [Phototrophicaceae bacterium]|nr:sugar transferase [Phototrophicaceae bacterium]
MAGDGLAIVLAVVIALAVWARAADDTLTLRFIFPRSYWFIILAFLWLVLASANDFYDPNIGENASRTIQRLLSITAQMLVVYLVVFFLSPRDALPRIFILSYGIISFVLIAFWRLFSPTLFSRTTEPRNVLIIGTNGTAHEIISAIQQQSHQAYTIRGLIGTTEEVGQMIDNVPVIGAGSDLMNFVRRDHISELVLTSTRDLSGDAFQGVMDAYEYGASLVPMPLLYERITGRVPVEHVRDNWAVVLPIEGSSTFSPYAATRRLIELVLSLIGMALFALILPLIALAIKLDSPGNIFYSQERVGLNGKIFRVYKFRTMVTNAEAQTGAVFSRRGDPRITRSGNFMRKVRLDETPQLLNILRGDMSLIGPRPERPEHVKRLTEKIPFYRTRHVIRPGLTGWAQVRYDYGATDEDALIKLQYDLYYIRHQSVLLDINILIRTIGRVLKMSGV